MALKKVQARLNRHGRVRKKVAGTATRPRLAVFRSNKHIYGQLIDDLTGSTLASASTLEAKASGSKQDAAKAVGALLGKKAAAAGITEAVFDRGGNRYHGRVASLADGAREAGLKV